MEFVEDSAIHFLIGPLPTSFFFIFVFSTVNSKYVRYKTLSMSGFEPLTYGIGSDGSANWAKTTAQGHNIIWHGPLEATFSYDLVASVLQTKLICLHSYTSASSIEDPGHMHKTKNNRIKINQNYGWQALISAPLLGQKGLICQLYHYPLKQSFSCQQNLSQYCFHWKFAIGSNSEYI